ncbi:MAG TPA: virulence factor [Pseudomonadales bacterium]|jgi:hypothetical protein|nr:hypothetical protein [Gammaproteobacteria bacterium]MDP6026554.1 virulence factor [Pseudomonadales bacterium]MDP6317144.1 virulence factor [Pseudomonadales bacterium]MDP7314066.1 virulence factor [Pseudomonadales bacterium]MDP7576217.1 virulence factor [Pseudomonadales bacterium]|tara:strand:- start:857 stop:1162 length:306 start_codon:yes stop_codon:yes gene_type:complete
MATLISIYWRDIPAQVIAREGRLKIKRKLPSRFATAIDRAAMRAGRGASDAYLEDWRRVSEVCDGGDIEKLADDKVSELVGAFDDAYLERVVKAGGLAKDG